MARSSEGSAGLWPGNAGHPRQSAGHPRQSAGHPRQSAGQAPGGAQRPRNATQRPEGATQRPAGARPWRKSSLVAAIALAGAGAIGWLGLYGFGWNDFEVEALGPVEALIHGHLSAFASTAPAYGGSLLLRAPFALLPSLWGGGELSVYRALALPCLLAAVALAIVIEARMRTAGSSAVSRALAVALLVCNPVLLPLLELGHPEELLLACLCVAAVLAASARRPLLAGVLVGLAIGCKYWPVIALGPVLLSLPRGRRRCLLACALAAAALLAPVALLGSHFLSASGAAASTTSAIFQPWQALWFLGRHGPAVHGLFGELKPGYRTAPSWVGPISHPLVVALGFALPAALWSRRRSGLSVRDGLALLALVLLARCLLDTFDNVYYTVPFLFALLAWQCERGGAAPPRPALLALGATILCWISFETLPAIASADAQSAFFLAWTVPLAAALALALYAPGPLARSSRARSWIAGSRPQRTRPQRTVTGSETRTCPPPQLTATTAETR